MTSFKWDYVYNKQMKLLDEGSGSNLRQKKSGFSFLYYLFRQGVVWGQDYQKTKIRIKE